MTFFNKPWFPYYGNVPTSIDYPEITLYARLCETMERVPNNIAWEFMGMECTYRDFVEQVDLYADALHALGLKQGEVITIAMPTAPNGIIPIYAANKIGVVCSMIHPLTPANQIKKFLNLSNSKYVITLDVFYWEFASILEETSVNMLILNQIQDYLEPVSKMGLWSMKKEKPPKVPIDPRVHWVKDLSEGIYPQAPMVNQNTMDCAIILYSGGITGEQKAIQLSNYNMIAQGMATASWGESWANPDTEDKILALLPIFHGFGLAVCVNAAFMAGATSVLVPDFNPKTVAKLVSTVKPNVLVGVPTLFEALANSEDFHKTGLVLPFRELESLVPHSLRHPQSQQVQNYRSQELPQFFRYTTSSGPFEHSIELPYPTHCCAGRHLQLVDKFQEILQVDLDVQLHRQGPTVNQRLQPLQACDPAPLSNTPLLPDLHKP